MRFVERLNNQWLYNGIYEEGMEISEAVEGFEEVNIPHTNIELPYNYFDEKIFQFVSCYKKRFTLHPDNKGKKCLLRFEGVMSYAKVYINGEYLGEHRGGYTPFQFLVTPYLQDENIITVIVDSTERKDTPPFGNLIDYLTYGGIYRGVSLTYYDELYIDNGYFKCLDVLEEKKTIDFNGKLIDSFKGELHIAFELSDAQGQIVHKQEQRIDSHGTELHMLIEDIEGVKLWDTENPHLYTAKLTVKHGGEKDSFERRVGFRTCQFTKDGFFLNGKPMKIRGLNRHQSFPYVGYAMPDRIQVRDADILKEELGLNLVRTSHYPQSVSFLDRCDEIGLLVFEEIPGWQYIGDEYWQNVAVSHVGEMIERDWNHPSIIMWGVRINESLDNDEFYKKTNALAHELDDMRQTGGVRCIEKSNLLEDVYTMNDFIHRGDEIVLRDQKKVTGLEEEVPYIVTEHNGHMFPTKIFDQEERLVEHALRHMRVVNAANKDPHISGAIGWCAFDYNTHDSFGSGDRICYHGVMDMFRHPKFAAHAYASQKHPSKGAVMEPMTYWTRGECDEGIMLPMYIMTNCDSVELSTGELKCMMYPDREEFPHLERPPVVIRMSDFTEGQIGGWGASWLDLELKGYIDGEVVVERKMAKDPLPATLIVEADESTLCSCEKDATRINIKVVDQYGNRLPYLEEVFDVDIKGPGKVQGPKRIVPHGGTAGFYIETLNEAGTIELTVSSIYMGSVKVTIVVE